MTDAHHARLGRRSFLGSAAATAATLAAGRPRSADAATAGDDFAFEIQRSEAEWRAMLDDAEFRVLREEVTERPHTSPLVTEARAGLYRCRGCDLPAYDARYKEPLDKGWVFFRHSEPNAVLTGIQYFEVQVTDMSAGTSQDEPVAKPEIEAHCRRCGSHLGHILLVEGQVLHCINGTSLVFEPKDA